MSRQVIRIYTGKIKHWTRDVRESKKLQSICGRRLLAFGLKQWEDCEHPLLPDRAEEVHMFLEQEMEKGPHGKPYFRDFSHIHFNISHTGEYAACALASIPCGLDIQEFRSVKSMRLIQRTMSEKEQSIILKSEEPDREFCRYWARKESFLKLTGEGITRDMKEIPQPAWYEMLPEFSNITGCISAGEVCTVLCREIMAEEFFEMFSE